ncbi:hypothetical protein J6TS2_23630 [Heyndrickxia sporothermodurans]|nr:hypothetical protein J6TS2_23630 [Heyndrickxia sporothermodurans]
MKKVRSLLLKVVMAVLVLGTLPSLAGLHAVYAEGPNDPAPEIKPTNSNGKKVLFDNTHGQTAGAADWVIDGGFSDFGNAVAKKGYYVKELRKTTPITYDDLKAYDVFVIGEANIPYKTSEQDAMLQYVQNGGSIFFISDHYNADRNKNRWDASEVFNGYRRGAYENPAKGMTTEEANSTAMQQVESSDWLADNFGVRFRYNALGDINANDIVSPEQSFGITQGVKSVAMHAGSTIAILNPEQAKGIVYLPKTNAAWPNAVDKGVYNGGGKEEGAYVAISKVGKGKAAFIGDSSPVEDATPKYVREENGSKKKTYDGFKEVDDGVLLTNIVEWLGNQEDYTKLSDKGIQLDTPTKLADFETPEKSTEPQPEPWAPPASGYKWYDSTTFKPGSYGSATAPSVDPDYSFVHQAVLPNAEEFQIRVVLDNLLPGQTVTGLNLGIYMASGGTQVAQFKNDDGTWTSGYGYSPDFSVTADAFGHAKKELTVKIKQGTAGAANIRIRAGKTNILTKPVTIDNVPAEPLPEDKPNLPEKISIEDARKVADGTIVTVEGVVTSEPGLFGGKGFYLQDGNAGIYVFQTQDGFKAGDTVKVTATKTIYNSEVELEDALVIEKTGTADIPSAKVVTELNADNQGQLVELENVKVNNLAAAGSSFEFDAVKDGKTTRVRVDSRTGITLADFSKKYKNGDVINVTGVSSIFKDVYQLKPLSYDHFKIADISGPIISDFDQLSFYQTDAFEQHVIVTDEGSGVAEVKITLDGKEVSNPIKVDPLSLSLGKHIVIVNAVDNAGNESKREFTLEVMMDVNHLGELITIGYDKGLITNKGIYNSLLSKVEGIQNANNENAKKGKLNALINEVQAQKGKKIDKDFAESLVGVIDYLK